MFEWSLRACDYTEMATADESSSTLILYLSPQLHHLPIMSTQQSTSSVNDMSAQLNVQSVVCSALPTSSEPPQNYVASTVRSAVEDNLPHADDDISDKRQFEMTAECIEDVSDCLLYTSPSPRDGLLSRMPSSA